jgi:NAD(P)H-hydrate repair Nnr-like enzyme with NAD(P)H-hydrate dehydratase domain
VSALHFLAKVQFWEAFGTRDVLVSIVASAVANAMKSWSEQVREEAAAAMRTLTAFAAQGQAARAPANWEDIANSASQAWPDIQTAAERAQIV